MIYSNTRLGHKQQQQRSLLLGNEEANMFDVNDKLLLPSSTRSLKRRTSLLEKSRDWARRLITLHRSRRNTISNEKLPDTSSEKSRRQPLKPNSSDQLLHNYQKTFDEDGYLSPMEIKAQLDNITHETANKHQQQSPTKISPFIYRYYDPNIQTKNKQKRLPITSFAAEFQKSLSIVDYIDIDLSNESNKSDHHHHYDDDPLESLKYLFNHNSSKQQSQYQGTTNISRRIPRRPTNVSSISTDSGYSEQPVSSSSASSKIIPVHLISCSLVPVNIRCLTCTCRSSSSSSSTTCLLNHHPHHDRKYYSHTSRSTNNSRPSLLNMIQNKAENEMKNSCHYHNKYYHSTMTIPTNIDEYDSPKKKSLKYTNVTDDLIAISRWYKPYLDREAVCNVLQQADYGAFILRNSTTHKDCYALSIKVPKFTHDSNIVHYLIEKNTVNNKAIYRIKGTAKQFPTLLALLTHHSVMPEILPITLNLNESFSI